MPVSVRDVEQVARLAKLEFSPEEKERLTHQLNTILEYMDQLNRLDTSGVEPLSHVADAGNVLREDARRPGLSTDEALQNAPDRTDEFFRVPKVIGERHE